ncbi:MAG: hypothetical protein N2C14_32960, partial [Planctomycetales bacterium]
MGKLESNLKRMVRRRVAESPELMREKKRQERKHPWFAFWARNAWFRILAVAFFGGGVLFAMFFMGRWLFESGLGYSSIGGVDLVFAVVSAMWLLFAGAIAAFHLLKFPSVEGTRCLAYWPLSDRAYSKELSGVRLFLCSLTLLVLVPFYLVIGLQLQLEWMGWLQLGILAILQGATTATTVNVLLVMSPPRINNGPLGLFVGIGAAYVLMCLIMTISIGGTGLFDVDKGKATAWMNSSQAAKVVHHAGWLPASWPQRAFYPALMTGEVSYQSMLVAGVLTCGALLITTWLQERRFRTREFHVSGQAGLQLILQTDPPVSIKDKEP